jgi:hypothetical protein
MGIRDLITVYIAALAFAKKAWPENVEKQMQTYGLLVKAFRANPVLRRYVFDEIPDNTDLIEKQVEETDLLIKKYLGYYATGHGSGFIAMNPEINSYYVDFRIAARIAEFEQQGQKAGSLMSARQTLAEANKDFDKPTIMTPRKAVTKDFEKLVQSVNKEELLSFGEALKISMYAFRAPNQQTLEDVIEYLFEHLKKVDMITIYTAVMLGGALMQGKPFDGPDIGKRMAEITLLMNKRAPFKHLIKATEEMQEQTRYLAEELMNTSIIGENFMLGTNPNASSYQVDWALTIMCFYAFLDENTSAVRDFMSLRKRINNTRG